ncbi:DoxX family protein [Defluviicoccus vanus]|uniref:DoxX family protein n=1 Tax=Defluviicoccus vanus TaxID=111831 RepID=A0A7H1MXI4_9PROT|nr:DoxX family protein [Defluviicoccus vanus]QNT68170.1 DoxX family protein [Defluviicoccus vanus]
MFAASSPHFSRASQTEGLIPAAIAVLERFPTSLLSLAFRVAVATVFFRSGLTKIASWDATVALFDMEYMLPFIPAELGAYLAATLELGAPVLLVLGLLTRPAAAALLGMTTVIQLFVYPENWPDHILWASILLYLVMRGAGAISVDHLIARWFSQRTA